MASRAIHEQPLSSEGALPRAGPPVTKSRGARTPVTLDVCVHACLSVHVSVRVCTGESDTNFSISPENLGNGGECDAFLELGGFWLLLRPLGVSVRWSPVGTRFT